MASQRRAPAGARHSLWGVLVSVAALFVCILGWPVAAEDVVQSVGSSSLNGTCLSNGASFYKSCWPVVLAHNDAVRSAYEALFPNSTAMHAHRDMLRELNVTADMLGELPSEQCCADAETFFGAAFQATCVNDPSIRPQLYGYTRDEIDAVAAFFGGLCRFAPAASTWPNTERSFVTEPPVGGRRLLQNCYQTASAPGPYCPSGYGHCNGNTCTFGTAACSADLTVCTCYYLNQCSCFPGDAHVETPDGRHVALRDLRVGDRVKAALPGGGFGFEEVYMFGHRDAAATAEFVSVGLAALPGRNESVAANLRLTKDHFIPIVPEGLEPVWANHVQTRGKDVRPGQVAFADVAGRLVPCLVTSVAVKRDSGLYNPYTMNGLIVVNGVLASAHSSWILDGLFDTMGWTSHLPVAYQALFAPLRALYLLVGPAAFSAALDSVGVESWGSALGAGAIRFDVSSVAAATALPLLVAAAYKGSGKWRHAA